MSYSTNCNTHKQLFRAILACVLCVMLAYPGKAEAREVTVGIYQPFLEPYISVKRPLGQSTLRWFGLRVYDIALWSEKADFSFDNTFALRIHYAMSFKERELTKSSIEEMNGITPLGEEETERYQEILQNALPSVEDGETITAVFVPRTYLRFYKNDQLYSTVEDMVFAKRFLEIWLHPESSYPEIARTLRGGKTG